MSAAGSTAPLKADAIDALLAAVEPDLAAFLRDQRAKTAPDLERDDCIGVQARMHPVVEAFMVGYAHERRRSLARGVDDLTQLTGHVSVIAAIADQIALNIAASVGVSRQDATETVLAMVHVTLTSGTRRHLGRFDGELTAATA